MSSRVQNLFAQKISGGGGGGSLAVANAWKSRAASQTAAVTVSPAAGSLLVVAICQFGTATDASSSISDNVDSTTGWSKICANGGGTVCCFSIWYKKNIPSGINTITCTGATGCSYNTSIVHEVTGASTTGPFVTGEYGVANGSGTTATTPSISNSIADSVFFACVVDSNGGNPTTFTLNATGSTPSTWALKDSTNSQETNGAAWQNGNVPHYIASSSSTRAHAWTVSSSEWACGITCFGA